MPVHTTFLYNLSKGDMLARFTNVLLVSSAEDRYVPHHSARIQLCGEAVHDGKHGPTFVSMVHRLHEQLAHCTVLHVDVSFGATAATSLRNAAAAAAAAASENGRQPKRRSCSAPPGAQSRA